MEGKDHTSPIRFLRRALELAWKGRGKVSPNPMVGAVLVKDGKIIGEGFHRTYGGKHAEAWAIEDAKRKGFSVEGADLYCTLEPCCFTGPEKHQPPCTDLLIRNRIKRVFLCTLDPHPRVRGKGVRILQEAGIEVQVGILASQALSLNEGFFTYQILGRPFVHLKIAQSIDGRIAALEGDSRWITDERARKMVHRLRATYDAVLVGKNTARVDDPELTVRLVQGRNPYRIVLDTHLELPFSSRIFHLPDPQRTIVVTETPTALPEVFHSELRGSEALHSEALNSAVLNSEVRAVQSARASFEKKRRSLEALGVRVLEVAPKRQPDSSERSQTLNPPLELQAGSQAGLQKVLQEETQASSRAEHHARPPASLLAGPHEGSQTGPQARPPAGLLDLSAVLSRLGELGIRSILVEGGAKVFTSFLREGLFDRITFFIAPMVIGKGIEGIGDLGIRKIAEHLRFEGVRFRRLGNQLVLDGYRVGFFEDLYKATMPVPHELSATQERYFRAADYSNRSGSAPNRESFFSPLLTSRASCFSKIEGADLSSLGSRR
jgi:diaminohydroxyphosphoribosylaminopyrimidine deaminase/5-amino-6-(5-phosphoribosylamino)uracil reductase